MRRQISKGKCYLCGGTFSKSGMTKHLKSCPKRETASEKPSSRRRPRKSKIFHLVVEGSYLPYYWMHLELPANATLEDLDSFLRDIWLECCGHLSAFRIEGKEYLSEPSEFDEEGMDVELSDVLSPGMKFSHEYDFGTTTELTLKVVSEQEGETKGELIEILARNEPPPITCVSCGKTATQVCSQCIWEGEGWLCDECSREHECGEDMLLPVVNSPRVGMCGYIGGELT